MCLKTQQILKRFMTTSEISSGLLNISKMSSGDWYKVLVENNLTMVSAKDRTLKPCKAELLNPAVNWEQTWSLACLGGLSSDDKTFLWKMLLLKRDYIG